jgi:hypothetical protein
VRVAWKIFIIVACAYLWGFFVAALNISVWYPVIVNGIVGFLCTDIGLWVRKD